MTAKKCVICGDAVDPEFKRFCSRRCADLDLQRWLSGGYRPWAPFFPLKLKVNF